MEKKKYFAFISYSHKDSELAKWLQHEFEYYELPATLFNERKDMHTDPFSEMRMNWQVVNLNLK